MASGDVYLLSDETLQKLLRGRTLPGTGLATEEEGPDGTKIGAAATIEATLCVNGSPVVCTVLLARPPGTN